MRNGLEIRTPGFCLSGILTKLCNSGLVNSFLILLLFLLCPLCLESRSFVTGMAVPGCLYSAQHNRPCSSWMAPKYRAFEPGFWYRHHPRLVVQKTRFCCVFLLLSKDFRLLIKQYHQETWECCCPSVTDQERELQKCGMRFSTLYSLFLPLSPPVQYHKETKPFTRQKIPGMSSLPPASPPSSWPATSADMCFL